MNVVANGDLEVLPIHSQTSGHEPVLDGEERLALRLPEHAAGPERVTLAAILETGSLRGHLRPVRHRQRNGLGTASQLLEVRHERPRFDGTASGLLPRLAWNGVLRR